MRQFLIYFISSLTCICMVIPQVVFANPAAAVGMAIVTGLDTWMGTQAIEEYQEWRETHPNNPISDFTDSFNGAHRALGVTLDTDGFSGHDGKLPDPSEITWTNNDKSFNDFDSAYQDYVSDLPCGSSYDSSGKLTWKPNYYVEFSLTTGNDNLETYSDHILSTTSNSLDIRLGDNLTYFESRRIQFRYVIDDLAPIDGLYTFLNQSAFGRTEYYTTDNTDLIEWEIYYGELIYPPNSVFEKGDSVNYITSNRYLKGYAYTTYYHFRLDNPIYEITDYSNSDNIITNNYNDNSRAWSITGGLALTNVSGDLTTINPSVKIVNETNNTYTNPETGITYPVSDWTYDYSDRSYTLHLDTTNVEEGDTIGDTVVVTYGDENITINEQHITYEGDTPVTTTETIPVYYIIENPQSQDPDDPGTVVDPGSDPDDSGCSCLCTKIGQQIAAGAFAYTNSGSGDFYSYVNIANGGTTTNTNTYNYYGSGPHDPTPTDPSTDPEEPGEHTHVYTEEVLSSPTCEDSGSSLWICSCGDHYTDHSDPLGHDFVYTTVPATCTEDGSKYKTCSRCGLVQQTEVIPAPSHDWFLAAEHSDAVYNEETGEFEATGTTTYEYECSRCGLRYFTEDDVLPPANYGNDEEPGFLDVIPNAFSSLAEFVSNLLSNVTGLCTNFTNFLVVVFPFIPVEFITVLELGFALFITAGVIRYFLR